MLAGQTTIPMIQVFVSLINYLMSTCSLHCCPKEHKARKYHSDTVQDLTTDLTYRDLSYYNTGHKTDRQLQ